MYYTRKYNHTNSKLITCLVGVFYLGFSLGGGEGGLVGCFVFSPVTNKDCSVLVTCHFEKLIAWRNFRTRLNPDDNFQDVQSHNIKLHLKTQRFPKKKKAFKKGPTICNSSRKRALGVC